MGATVSFVAGLCLLFMGTMAMIAYRPSVWREKDGPHYLGVAIFLGFFAAVANTVWWQILGQPIMSNGWVTREVYQNIGGYLDAVFKGGAALAGYLHLKALHHQLDASDRRRWHVLEMAFYPQRRKCLQVMLNTLMRKTGQSE